MTQLADLPSMADQIRHITHWQDMYVTSPEMQRAILASLESLEAALARAQAAERWLTDEAWSFCRRLLEQGAAIQQDNAHGKYPTYEHFSARLDEAARDRAQQLEDALSAQAKQSDAKKEGVG